MPSVVNLSASRALIQRGLEGDFAALWQLHYLYVSRVYDHAYRHLGQPEAAAEVTDATFQYAFAHLSEYDPRRSSAGTWLRRIAEDLCRARARRPWPARLSARLGDAATPLAVLFAAVLTVCALFLAVSTVQTRARAATGVPGPLEPARAQPPGRAVATGWLRTPGSTAGARPTREAAPEPGQRVTVLVMGLDHRPGEYGPAHADTLMLLSLDPAAGDAAVLSIPRDLYVDIPGYGPNRMNSAFYLGELYHEPEGGPGLTVRTIKSVLGVTVDHWVVFEFGAFEQGIDLLGGVDVDVPRALYDPSFPTANGGTEVFALPAGPQHLDGLTALKYVRTRHVDNDFGRTARQRQMLLAVKSCVADLKTWARLAPKLPGFLAGLGDEVRSDLTPDQMLELAWAGVSLDSAHIRQLTIGPDATSDFVTELGAQVLLPKPERVNAVVHEFLSGDRAAPEDVQSIEGVHSKP